MHPEQGRDETELGREVPVADRVHRVRRGTVEAEFGGDRLRVQRQRGTGQRARAERGHRSALVPVPQAADVAGEGVRVGEQLMGENHRLRVLEVRHARHRGLDVLGGLREQRRLQLGHARDDEPYLVAQVQAQVGGDLVVAAAAGPQLAAERADPLEQAAFERGVHVLVGGGRAEPAVAAGLPEAVQGRQQPGELLVVQQPGLVQHARVRGGGEQIVGRQPPVKLDADRQPRECLRRPGLEPASPQPCWLALLLCHRVPLLCLHRDYRGGAQATGRGARAQVLARCSRIAATLLGSPHSSTNPLASAWSKVSPVS